MEPKDQDTKAGGESQAGQGGFNPMAMGRGMMTKMMEKMMSGMMRPEDMSASRDIQTKANSACDPAAGMSSLGVVTW